MNKLAALYPIRFIASVGVVFFHYLPFERDNFFERIVDNSNEFVNLFFFISGLVLSYANARSLDETTFNKRKFYINRFARLYPIYLLALIMVLVLAYLYQIDLGRTTYYKVPFEILTIQTWLYPGSINYPGWSLSVEMFFYVFFPFIFQRTFAYFKVNSSRFIVWLVVYFFLVFAINILVYKPDLTGFVLPGMSKQSIYNFVTGFVEYQPVFRMGYFICGMFCYSLISGNFKADYFRRYATVNVLTSILLFAIILGNLERENAIFLRSGLGLIIYFYLFISLYHLNTGILSFLSRKEFVFLGNISYGIYILQYPAFLFYDHTFHKLDNYHDFTYFLIFLIVISSILFVLVEDPLNKYIRKKTIR